MTFPGKNVKLSREWQQDKAALRGEPSYVWRAGQARRLEMIMKEAGDRVSGRILDNGCGVGLYLKQFAELTDNSFGTELDFERARGARERNLCITCSAAEALPFPADSFDLILSHEVLEHVDNDRRSIEEMARILCPPDDENQKAGGRLILFVPNRGYPFETHGIYWRSRYIFGNIPLINYLPKALRNRLAPHVRIYSTKDLQQLLQELPLQILHRGIIFGAYDNIIARWPTFGRILRGLLQFLEGTPLRIFGLSHFWVVEKTN